MKLKINGLLTLFLALFMQIGFAQTKTVTGTVTDQDGLPLPGVNILVKGEKTGTQTDFDGEYSIRVNSDQSLIFRYVGFKTQTIKVNNQDEINVEMKLESGQLDEVVVTAYGAKKRDQLTSAVSVVSGEELTEMAPSTSIDNMLQGKAAGVSVTAQNGQPGQTAYIRIRGIGSINASSAPLYLIDGVVAPNLNSVNPNDIESVSILKDAATASRYGSRAANGVVVITTKSGSKNKDAVIQFTSRYGYSQKIDDNYDMMNAQQKIRYERELASLGVTNAQGLPGATANQEEYERLLSFDNDWQETLLRRGVVQSNNVSISGGEEKFGYFFSVGHDINEGIIDAIDGFERLNTRLNVDYQAKEWLKIGTNISVTSTSSDEPRDRNNVQNPFRAMYDYNPYETKYVRDENGDIALDENGERIFNPTRAGFSISEALVNNPETQYRTTIIGGAYVDAQLTEGLKNTFRIGATNERYRREYFIKPGSILDGFVGDSDNPGIKVDNGENLLDYTVTNILSYNKFYGKHNFELSALFEYNERETRTYLLESIGFASGDLSVQAVAAAPTDASTNLFTNTLMSVGSFLDYNYDGKYIATASIRRDESSNFGVNNKYGIFWSASAAWNVSDEDFFDLDFVDNFKIRTSAGTSGNRSGIGSYAAVPTIGFGSLGGNTTAIPEDNGNPDLGFEKNFIFDVGIEFGMFNNRFRGVIDYYSRTTSDLLLERPLLSLGGEPDGVILSNIGEMRNSGVEIELNGDVIATDDWFVKIGGNVSFLDNEVTGLVSSLDDPEGAPIDRDYTTIRVGEEINTFFIPRYAGINPANGEPLYYDENGDVTNAYDANANEVLSGKSRIADVEGGFNTSISYKNFNLNADFFFRYGHYIYNIMEANMLSDGTGVDANQRLDAFNYWRNPGDVDVLPSPLYGNEAQQTSDRFLQKGDYIRLRNLTFGYTFDSEQLANTGLNSVRLYVQGQNLWTYIPHFKGDPEVGIGSGETNNTDGFGTYNLYSYPQTQSLSLGLDIKF